ncbi:MAG TPA: alpha/beta hydrolase [Bryobacteraceae bacterium]|nr:alpha/beta hydrolase [Bryobacteraceae bacterium]
MIRIRREARGKVAGDGVQLAFGMWPGRGEPVIALHGLTANFLNFVGVAERLEGRRPLLAFDLRGRGDSDKPEGPYGLAQHARDVAVAMQEFGLGRSVVMGHSMGGFVAMALAAQNPELVERLVLIDGGFVISPKAGAKPDESVSAALAERINQLTRWYDSREAYREFWKNQPNFPPEEWNSWVEAFLDYEVAGEDHVQPKAKQSGVIVDLMEGTKIEEIIGRVRAVKAPITLLRAETGFTPAQSPLYPDSIMDEIRGYAPNLEERKISGTTHYTLVLGERGAKEIAMSVECT